MNKTALTCICLLLALLSNGQSSIDAKMNQFISDLMGKMTLEEKIGQLYIPTVGVDVTGPVMSKDVEEKIKKGLVGAVYNAYTPSAVRKLQEMAVKESRLKIPLLFAFDVIHGHKTIFPIPLALSCTWDTALIEKTARTAASEATADGLNWLYSPMVDIARDPRWGRVSEGAGEDAWWGSKVAAAMVHGYQGNSFAGNNTLLACVKHYGLYGAVEAGRDYNTVDMSQVKMYNDYLPPYKAAVDAGVATVMSSFNEINGVPATGNRWLLTDLLRRQWGFKGFVVTDYEAIEEMLNHGIGDSLGVTAAAMNAGADMDLVGEFYNEFLPVLVKEGKVPVEEINEACRLVLEAKYKLGLFDNPYKYVSEERARKEILSNENKQVALKAAQEGMVLLKNENHTLPLKKSQKVAFIGPLVKDQRDLLGSWHGAGDWHSANSVWTELQQKAGKDNFLYAQGCDIVDAKSYLGESLVEQNVPIGDSADNERLLGQAVQTANQADIIVAVLGEAREMSGEAASRSEIDLPGNQKKLLQALVKTGKPVVLVLMNGRPLTLQWENDNTAAILEAWFPGTMGAQALADILYGDVDPSGKLTMTFPRNVGQIPIYYNHKNTGRPFDSTDKYTSRYLDVPNTPLYPFGYGLSYTSFAYGKPVQSAPKLKMNNGAITFSVEVSNTGDMDGEEVVQFYVRAKTGSITRPVQQLEGVQKIFLKKGESKKVDFLITANDLKFYNADLQYVNEPGMYEAMIGPNSANVSRLGFELVR